MPLNHHDLPPTHRFKKRWRDELARYLCHPDTEETNAPVEHLTPEIDPRADLRSRNRELLITHPTDSD